MQGCSYRKLLLPLGLENTRQRLGLLELSNSEEGSFSAGVDVSEGANVTAWVKKPYWSDSDRNSEQMGMSKSLLPPPPSRTPLCAPYWQSPTGSSWLRGKVAGRVPDPASEKRTKQGKVGLELRGKSFITKRVTWENSLVCS